MIFVGIGSNLPDASGRTPAEVAASAPGFLAGAGAQVVRLSRLWSTAPFLASQTEGAEGTEGTKGAGAPPQPRFINAVAEVAWPGEAHDLLARLLEAEARAGRIRTERTEPTEPTEPTEGRAPGAPPEPRWQPRVLDLDLLDFKGRVCESEPLTLPHPEMHRRAFVLRPLQELAPQWRHPVSGLGIAALLAEVEGQDAQPLGLPSPPRSG